MPRVLTELEVKVVIDRYFRRVSRDQTVFLLQNRSLLDMWEYDSQIFAEDAFGGGVSVSSLSLSM